METNNTKDILSKVLIFAVGAAIGSTVTWKVVSTKYERLIQKEIDDVKKVYGAKMETEDKTENDETAEVNDAPSEYYEKETLDDVRKRVSRRLSERDRYETIVNEQGYLPNETKEETVKKDDIDMEEYEMTHIEPYMIVSDELGDCGYPTVTVDWYTDGFVVNKNDKIINNPEELFGYNNDPTDFFESNPYDDTLCIRNENLGVDYEITRNLSNYLEG